MVRAPRTALALWLPILLLTLAMAAYAAYFSTLTLTRYAAFEARALDMGNLNQAIWNTAHGRWFHLTNQEGTVNRLSLHVEPILLPIAALYRLYPRPELLLVLQAAVVALGALPLFALARHKLARHQVAGPWLALIFGVAFLLNPSIQAANWLEFHPVTLAPTFLLAAFYFLITGRNAAFALFAVLAAACKEEMALLIFMQGLYAALALRRVRLGALTMGLSLLWAGVAVFYIQNTFAAGNIHWGRYAYLGDSPAAMLSALATRPALIWAQLRQAHAVGYLALLLLPVGFTGLLAPDLLFLALPSLAINLLADFPPMHQVTELIYAAPIVPFVMIAGVFGVARLLAAARPPTRGRWAAVAAGGLVLGGALLSQRLYGYLPGGANHRLYAVTPHHRTAAALIAQIPPAAKVSAQDKLNPHVSGRATVYIFPRVEEADTVFLDVTGPAWPIHPSDVKAAVDGLLAQGFGVAAAADGYLLLARDAAGKDIPASFYTAWQRPGHAPQNPVQVDFDGRLRLLDYQVTTDPHGELVTQLYWQALQPLGDENLTVYVAYLDEDGAPLYDTRYYPPAAALWYPTSLWEPGLPVLVQTLPWTLDADRFTLAVGVAEGDAGWNGPGRLPVTAVDPARPVLENGTLVRLGAFERTDRGAWAPVPAPAPSPARPLDVRFGSDESGGPAVLDGVTVTVADAPVRPGDAFDFTLHWHAAAPLARDYSLFVHVLDAAGNKVAQLDWQPQDAAGRLPMTAWIAGQPVVDSQSTPLPAELAPGSYRAVLGVYDWESGARLPATGAAAADGDVAVIAEILVE